MRANRLLSFLVGVVATSALVVSGLYATPHAEDREVPEQGAWMWRTAATPLTWVPFASPMEEPGFERADDDSVYAVSDTGPVAERLDVDALTFAPPSRRPEHAPPFAPPEALGAASRMPGSAGMWVADRTAGAPRPTFFHRARGWVPGPTLTSREDHFDAQALGGARVAVFTSSTDGPSLWVASESDAAFQSVPLRGTLWSRRANVAAVGSDGSRLLVVTWTHEPGVRTHVIDTTSGTVTDGPPLDRPLDASSVWRVYGAWLPGGGVIVVGNGMHQGVAHLALTCVAAALLLVEILALGAALAKKKLARRPFALGVVAGLVPLALLTIEVLRQIRW